MEKISHTLTLVVEEDVLNAARKVAIDQGTSVDQLVQDYLSDLAQVSSRRRLASARLKETMKRGLVEPGEITWSRDELYER